MATKRMLVDAIHPEETRIVVTSGNRLEEFDFESATRRQLRGNIYLAKVTRVEPSLQAAFVDYGGNRHGFGDLTDVERDIHARHVVDADVDAGLLIGLEAFRGDPQRVQTATDRRYAERAGFVGRSRTNCVRCFVGNGHLRADNGGPGRICDVAVNGTLQ